MEEKLLMGIVALIIILVGILVWMFVVDDMTKAHFVRAFVCGLTFWIPFGALGMALTQGCAGIPV